MSRFVVLSESLFLGTGRMSPPRLANSARDELPPDLRPSQAKPGRGRGQGAERSGVGSPRADERGSFIEQIGGARTGPRRRLGAMASRRARCDFHQAPPGGSI
jgi:hypothetical protein